MTATGQSSILPEDHDSAGPPRGDSERGAPARGDESPVGKKRSWIRRAFTGKYRWLTRIGLLVFVLLIALGVDFLLLVNRIGHFDVRLHASGQGDTFVIIGSDSRSDIPAGTAQENFGSTDEVPGQRADVVLVVHRAPDGTSTTLSIPRDMLVQSSSGSVHRLALTLLDGPQALLDGLCHTLGIPSDHVVVIDFAGFASTVDTLGGITVDLPYRIRDQQVGLQLDAGSQRLDGATALELVRSRNPQQFIDDVWTDSADGAGRRTYWAGTVFAALQSAAKSARTDPVLLQRLAWTLTGDLTTDSGTGIFDLAGLVDRASTPVDLPAKPVTGSELSLTPSDDTWNVLAQAGFQRDCR